jgi:uncharacterized protein (TIGR03067 family)
MRRTVYSVCAVLLVVVGLGSDSPREYDDKTEVAGIEGTWRFTESELVGHKKWKAEWEEVRYYRRETYTYNGRVGETDRGRYRIERTRKPSHFDYTPSNGYHQGQTIKCLYELHGDTLKIAERATWDDVRRPLGFDEVGVIVRTYKRVR